MPSEAKRDASEQEGILASEQEGILAHRESKANPPPPPPTLVIRTAPHSSLSGRYIKDVSEESRTVGNLLFGFIPLSGANRIFVNVAMRLMSFCQLLSKSIELSVLYELGGLNLVLGVGAFSAGLSLIYDAEPTRAQQQAVDFLCFGVPGWVV